MARRRWRAEERGRSQHFLAHADLAGELVAAACITRDDVVLDVGAGTGLITDQLAGRARRVIAVESDPSLARRLRQRFSGTSTVDVIEADVLDVALPKAPFKVVSNPPFHITTPLLRHLLAAHTRLVTADLVISWGHGIGLTQIHPPSSTTLAWQPWFELILTRRLDARCFRPAPSVHAAVISIRRRAEPLLHPDEEQSYRRYLALIRAGRTPRGVADMASLASSDVWAVLAGYRRWAGRPTAWRD